MRSLKVLFFVICCMSVSPLLANLAMRLTPNQSTYMQYEPVYMHLRIRNDSGRPVVFGQNAKLRAKLYFEITDLNGRLVPESDAKPITMTKGKVINPGQIGDIIIKFSNYYKLPRRGIYRIHAYISHPMFKEQYKSNDVRVEISSGVTVWSRTVGMPDGKLNKDGNVVSTDSTRTYSIRKLNDGKNQYFYCVLEDKDKVYQIFRMAPVTKSGLPELMIDMSGALHVLVNVVPRIYKYCKLDITGEVIEADKYYKVTKTSPALFKGKDGKIFVTGGAPAMPNVDFHVREQTYKFAE